MFRPSPPPKKRKSGSTGKEHRKGTGKGKGNCCVFAASISLEQLARRGPVGWVRVGLWDTCSATEVPVGQHPSVFLGEPGRGAPGHGLKRKELPASRWRFCRGLELYRRRKGATGNGSCRCSEDSRLCRMVDTPSCLQIGQEPGLRQRRRGVCAGRRESSSHLPPTRQLTFIDKVTHLSYNHRILYSLSRFISKEPGPRWAAPKGSRQLWWQDPVKDVPLQQHQDENSKLQQGEEQEKSPGGQERGQAEQGANLSQLFPTTLFEHHRGTFTVLGTALPAQDWSEGPGISLGSLLYISPVDPKMPPCAPRSGGKKEILKHYILEKSKAA